jgi:hypothetical protein
MSILVTTFRLPVQRYKIQCSPAGQGTVFRCPPSIFQLSVLPRVSYDCPSETKSATRVDSCDLAVQQQHVDCSLRVCVGSDFGSTRHFSHFHEAIRSVFILSYPSKLLILNTDIYHWGLTGWLFCPLVPSTQAIQLWWWKICYFEVENCTK